MQPFVTDHRDYLKRELNARIQRRPLYSQRAFARDLGLSSSSLTDYLKGRMRLSSGRISQLSKSLAMTAEQRQHWLDLLDCQFSKCSETKTLAERRVRSRLQAQSYSLSLDQFKVISDWYHFAYLELIEMDAEKYSNLKTAAKALALPLKTLSTTVKRLKHLGLLRELEGGVFQVDSSTQLGDQAPSEAIRQYHSQILKKALVSIESQGMEKRFTSSTFVALPKAEVTKVLEKIKSAAFEILDPHLINSQKQKKDSLYCLSLQFFDLLHERK
jgi:uncharacterized protein (TIGR02147 family)